MLISSAMPEEPALFMQHLRAKRLTFEAKV
jgi:hypothetical protein